MQTSGHYPQPRHSQRRHHQPRQNSDSKPLSGFRRAQPQSSLYEVFPHLKQTPNFHCTSFFRTDKCTEPKYNPLNPFVFRDGRVYEVLEFKIVAGGFDEEVAWRCCVDVIERETSEFIPFEIWFYKSAFGDTVSFKKEPGATRVNGKPFDEAAERDMMQFARQWIWEFLYTKRNAVDWSNYGYPYIGVCR